MDIHPTDTQNYDEDYYPIDYDEMEDACEACPRCETTLKICYLGTHPDDYTTGVICPNCKWYETD